eukprot:scaffold3761_cov42-Phaeocystis_antarctica.AAC.4
MPRGGARGGWQGGGRHPGRDRDDSETRRVGEAPPPESGPSVRALLAKLAVKRVSILLVDRHRWVASARRCAGSAARPAPRRTIGGPARRQVRARRGGGLSSLPTTRLARREERATRWPASIEVRTDARSEP